MRQLLREIYEKGAVTGRSGNTHPLHSMIDPREGEFLFDLISRDPEIRKTLEVGCAYGLSSLHICMALQGRTEAAHTIVDPFQNTQWDGVGTKHLEQAGVDFFELVEACSEFALPRILERNEGQFDFVFIDGWHTFDHTLLDSFYATRLLRVGGYLVIDDAGMPPVYRAVSFLKNYPCYRECGAVSEPLPKTWKKVLARALLSPLPARAWARVLQPGLHRIIYEDRAPRMIAFQKIAEDRRDWDWHMDLF